MAPGLDGIRTHRSSKRRRSQGTSCWVRLTVRRLTVSPSQHVSLAICRWALGCLSRPSGRMSRGTVGRPARSSRAFQRNPHHLVGERGDRDRAVAERNRVGRATPARPGAVLVLCRGRPRLPPARKELSDVPVASLADAAQGRLPARGELAGDEPEPRRPCRAPCRRHPGRRRRPRPRQ